MRRKTKLLGKFQDGNAPVKCWLRVREREICFRVKGSRRVIVTTLRDVYDSVTGQIKMPFV
ncbi:MAG TPA: hypothetical protein VFB72_19410 [Verrucomicrobiae bacterium]|nr:hypothetical protein [Verrucomicrobiae bacterium]